MRLKKRCCLIALRQQDVAEGRVCAGVSIFADCCKEDGAFKASLSAKSCDAVASKDVLTLACGKVHKRNALMAVSAT